MSCMINANKLFLVDSNMIIYAFELTESDKNQKAKKLIDECWIGKIRLAVSSQNLAEFAYTATSKAKLDFRRVKTAVDYIASFDGFIKINYSTSTVLTAIDIANEYNMPFWDSLLAATMKENGIFNIYTENTKDFKIPWINAVNPFKK